MSGMLFSQARQKYYDTSAKLSEVSRQLCYAGIAVIWLFRVGGDEAANVPYSDIARLALLLFVISLAVDLLHYLGTSLIWGLYCRYKETKKFVNESIVYPWPSINSFALVCFCTKAFSCLIGALLLVWHVGSHL